MTETQLTLDQALQQAVAHHRAGQLQDAERLYRAILQAQPQHPDANHNLGVLAVGVGQPAAALPFFKTALEAQAQQGQYWLSYADALLRTGQTDNARHIIDEARRRGLPAEALAPLAAQLPPVSTPAPTPLITTATADNLEPHVPAIAHREAGRYPEAAAWLENYLTSHPGDAAALALLAHVLLLDKQETRANDVLAQAQAIAPELPVVRRNQARLALKKNQPAIALQAATAALQADPHNPESWLVQAAALGANQRDPDALPLIERALQARPDYAEAWANRALIRLRAKDKAGALADIERALSFKPHLAQFWQLAASLRYEAKNLPGAIEALEKSLAIEPDDVSRMVNLGEFLRRAERIDEALALLKKAVSLAPENYGAWVNYGTALQASGQIDAAKSAYEKALAINPKSAEIASNLGAIAKDREDWETALRCFEQALIIQPDHAEIMGNKAAALNGLERAEEAVEAAHRAIELDGKAVAPYVVLTSALITLGQLTEAKNALDIALNINTESPEALCCLADLQKSTPDSPSFAVLERFVTTATPSKRKAIHFALGKMYDETERHSQAFAHYQAGNALRRAKSGAYDPGRDQAWLSIMRQMFPAEVFDDLAGCGTSSRRPIFVVGMPRSGTTLTEQILASHAQVFGAGELNYFLEAIAQTGRKENGITLIDGSRPLQTEGIQRIAQGYLDFLDGIDTQAAHVVDKMPHNFERLGLMALCFPEATFLHVERDPVDTCLSCYFQNFSTDRHGYSDDLVDLGRHYLYYRAMMDYWRGVLPVHIHSVRYEALVSEPDVQIPALLAACGLAMDENCLQPHRTERSVRTASKMQVREPIHRASVQKWRRYEQELQPLITVLREGGITD